MPLYKFSNNHLHEIKKTTYSAVGILEKDHLQSALRDDISILGADLLVIAEEFTEFADSQRRIDLLCVDRNCQPVVVELKRTEDGGHMELQALRYAAMVSALTFDDLVETFESHLRRIEGDSTEARSRLLEHFDASEGDEPVVSREVRIILASSDFSKEIMTTVLWLNEVFGLDVTCIRLIPYQTENGIMVNVEQVIPLPEAAELTVKLKKREVLNRAASASGADWTPFVISVNGKESGKLRKRWAVLRMVQAVAENGADAAGVLEVLGDKKFRRLSGRHEEADLGAVMVDQFPNADPGRWFLDDPVIYGDDTWIVSNQWGRRTAEVLAKLQRLVPAAEITFRAWAND